MIYYDKSGRRLYRPVRREEANEEAEVAERRSIVGTLIGLAVLAAAVLIAISYLSGCTAGTGTHSGPAVQQRTALPTALPPGRWATVPGPQGIAELPIGAGGAYVLCEQPGVDWGATYDVRVSDQAYDSLIKTAVPCPAGPIIAWTPASVITSVDGMHIPASEPYVTCSDPSSTQGGGFAPGLAADVDIAPDNKAAVYHVGDQCPNGARVNWGNDTATSH